MPDEREPGYCLTCGDFHLLTPVPGRHGGVCGSPSCRERLEPYEPGPRHVCNTGDRLKPGHPEYRQCGCGQWYHSGGGYWYEVARPPVRWLRSHGLDGAEDLWGPDGNGEGEKASPFGAFFYRVPWLQRLLWFLRQLR